MLKRYIPYVHAKSIYDVDVEFFVLHGVKVLLLDLDNTLDSYKTKDPSKRAIELKKKHERAGIAWYITSNNTGKRVERYANALGVKYLSCLGKPFASKLNKKLLELGIDKNCAMMIGDQTVTDVCCANGAKIKSMLTDKIVEEDQPTTYFNRIFDRIYRKQLKKHNLLREWEDVNHGNDK